MNVLDDLQIRRVLNSAIDRRGGLALYARHVGISSEQVQMILRGELSMGERVLRDIGFMRVARYVRREITKEGERDGLRVDG